MNTVAQPSDGYRLKIPLQNTVGLPPIESYIYVEWHETDSSEPPGWYHCQVIEYHVDSSATLVYRDGATESIDLHSVKWFFTRKNGKAYLPTDTTPPTYPLKKQRDAAMLPKYAWSDSHKSKAYADDLTLLSVSKQDHQLALSSLSRSCQDLGFEIRPDKCVSYCFDGHKSLPRLSFSLIEGHTTNISVGPTKFLGETLGITPTQSKRLSSKKLSSKVFEALERINERPIRGEYKVWIYKSYLIPSVSFNLTVDRISLATSKKIQTKITSYLKRWLKLPRCATLASLFHPQVLNLPYLPHQLEKAKLRFLASTTLSSDHNVQALAAIVCDPQFIESEDIPRNSADLLRSCQLPKKKSAMKKLYTALTDRHATEWNNHLESLSVQGKFLELIPLELESSVWSRILTSLPAGQLSFLLRAGIDCLPTPVTLSRWHYQCNTSCKLCHSHSCTVHHVLNCCPASLNQGRYTWRHDSVLKHLSSILKSNVSPDTVIFVDLPGFRAVDSPPSTIPPHILSTSARPDIVILEGNVITLLELTIPINTKIGLQNARARKQAKDNYISLLGDLEARGFTSMLETVEIGSLGHFFSRFNKFTTLYYQSSQSSFCTKLNALTI